MSGPRQRRKKGWTAIQAKFDASEALEEEQRRVEQERRALRTLPKNIRSNEEELRKSEALLTTLQNQSTTQKEKRQNALREISRQLNLLEVDPIVAGGLDRIFEEYPDLIIPEIKTHIDELRRVSREILAYDNQSPFRYIATLRFMRIDPRVALREQQARLLDEIKVTLRDQVRIATEAASEIGAEEIAAQTVNVRNLEDDLGRQRAAFTELSSDAELQSIAAEEARYFAEQVGELKRDINQLPSGLYGSADGLIGDFNDGRGAWFESLKHGLADGFPARTKRIWKLREVLALDVNGKMHGLRSRLTVLPEIVEGLTLRDFVAGGLADTGRLFEDLSLARDSFDDELFEISERLQLIEALESNVENITALATTVGELREAIVVLPGGEESRNSAEELLVFWETKLQELLSGDTGSIPGDVEVVAEATTIAIGRLQNAIDTSVELARLQKGLAELPVEEEMQAAATATLTDVARLLREMDFNGGSFDADLAKIRERLYQVDVLERSEEAKDLARVLARVRGAIDQLPGIVLLNTLRQTTANLLRQKADGLQRLKQGNISRMPSAADVEEAAAAVDKLNRVVAIGDLVGNFVTLQDVAARLPGEIQTIIRENLTAAEHLFHQRLYISAHDFNAHVLEIERILRVVEVLEQSQAAQDLAVRLRELQAAMERLPVDDVFAGLKVSAIELLERERSKLESGDVGIIDQISEGDVAKTIVAIQQLEMVEAFYEQLDRVRAGLEGLPEAEGLQVFAAERLNVVGGLIAELRVGGTHWNRALDEIGHGLRVIDALEESPEAKSLAEKLGELQAAINELPGDQEPRVSAEALLAEGRARLELLKTGTADPEEVFDISRITEATRRANIARDIRADVVALQEAITRLLPLEEGLLVIIRANLTEVIEELQSLSVNAVPGDFETVLSGIHRKLQFVSALEQSPVAQDFARRLPSLNEAIGRVPNVEVFSLLIASARDFHLRGQQKLGSGDAEIIREISRDNVVEMERAIEVLHRAAEVHAEYVRLQESLGVLPTEVEDLRGYAADVLESIVSSLIRLAVTGPGFMESLAEIEGKLQAVKVLEGFGEVATALVEQLGLLAEQINQLPNATVKLRNFAEEIVKKQREKLRGLIDGTTTVEQSDVDEVTKSVSRLQLVVELAIDGNLVELQRNLDDVPEAEGLRKFVEGNLKYVEELLPGWELDDFSFFRETLDEVRKSLDIAKRIEASAPAKALAIQVDGIRSVISASEGDFQFETVLLDIWDKKFDDLKAGVDESELDLSGSLAVATLILSKKPDEMMLNFERTAVELMSHFGSVDEKFRLFEADIQNAERIIVTVRDELLAEDTETPVKLIQAGTLVQTVHGKIYSLHERLNDRIKKLEEFQRKLKDLSEDELIRGTMNMGLFALPEEEAESIGIDGEWQEVRGVGMAEFEAWKNNPNRSLPELKELIGGRVDVVLDSMQEHNQRADQILQSAELTREELGSVTAMHQDFLKNKTDANYKSVADGLDGVSGRLKTLLKQIKDYRASWRYVLYNIFVGIITLGIAAYKNVKGVKKVQAKVEELQSSTDAILDDLAAKANVNIENLSVMQGALIESETTPKTNVEDLKKQTGEAEEKLKGHSGFFTH